MIAHILGALSLVGLFVLDATKGRFRWPQH